jgi:hypothetical protein
VNKDWKLIAGFAVFGLAVTGPIAFLASSAILDFVVFCPPILLAIPFSEVMKDKGSAYVIWALIGLLNSALYAVVGAAVAGLRKKSV